MLKVLTVSRNEVDNELIHKKLQPVADQVGSIQFSSARPANVMDVIELGFNLIVFNCIHFNSSVRNHLQQWRSMGYFGPVIILAKFSDVKVIDHFADMKNVTIVEKPYEKKDLQGIAEKYLSDTVVRQRRFRRFDTEQTASLEAYNKDFSGVSTISNISKGGVHIMGNLEDLSKGDILRVCFEFDQLKKNHTMSAEVVWTRGEVGAEDRAAGLRFITKNQVYKALLQET